MTYIDPKNDLSQTNKPIWRFLRNLAIAILICIALVFIGKWGFKKVITNESVTHLHRQLAEMKQQNRHVIDFYCTSYTDELLVHLRGNTEVEYIGFKLADITDDGLQHLTTLPNLKGILLYGGIGISNKSLINLKQMPRLERLILRNTGVSDEGIRLLNELPHLKYLGLDYDAMDKPVLTDAALVHLEKMTNLKTIDLSGRWYSRDAAERLKTNLPTCSVRQFQHASPDSEFEP